MKKIVIFSLFLTILLAVGVFFNTGTAQAALNAPDGSQTQLAQKSEKLPVYFFWGDGCPHCHDELIFLQKIKDDYPEIEWLNFETWNNEANYQLLLQVTKEKGGRASGSVPVTVIGDELVVGFSGEDTTGAKIKQLLDIYIVKSKLDNNGDDEPIATSPIGEKIKYPLLGEINLKNLSLPFLTVILGTLDGFNPCSMWALVVLITLLINTGSKKKLWLVGNTFIIASSLSYFLFLTAWFNTFLFVGYLPAVKILIGILAVGVGIYFLNDFYKKRKLAALTCEVTSETTKNKLIARLERAVQKESVLAIIIAVVFVAFSVNLIELLCSAGIPAVYTQVLSQNNLSKIGYYLYLLVYDFFYMLDDIVVLVIAGFTWQLLISTNKYTKYSHLIGGILLLILGIIMLVNPQLLMFK